MKEFEIVFTETVTYTTIIEAETEEEAREIFFEGNWNDTEEYDRRFNDISYIKEVE